MIQDIFPKKLYNTYRQASPNAESPILLFREGKLLGRFAQNGQDFCFPSWSEVRGSQESIYLFSVDEEAYFLVPDVCEVRGGYELYSLRELRDQGIRAREKAYVAFTAFHLWKWYRTNRFCGACGEKLVLDAVERALVCPSCGNRVYPRINPAVIIGILGGERILITRYRTGYAHNALVAGFVEIGETLEETVEREVMEEVGLKVKNIRYYKSQPWGMAQDVLMGFFCEVDGEDTIHMDETELKYAQWVTREELELQPSDYSLTNEMMRVFKEGGLASQPDLSHTDIYQIHGVAKNHN